jgi:hypothetical protein
MSKQITFDQLPLRKDAPFGNAWGRFGYMLILYIADRLCWDI